MAPEGAESDFDLKSDIGAKTHLFNFQCRNLIRQLESSKILRGTDIL